MIVYYDSTSGKPIVVLTGPPIRDLTEWDAFYQEQNANAIRIDTVDDVFNINLHYVDITTSPHSIADRITSPLTPADYSVGATDMIATQETRYNWWDSDGSVFDSVLPTTTNLILNANNSPQGDSDTISLSPGSVIRVSLRDQSPRSSTLVQDDLIQDGPELGKMNDSPDSSFVFGDPGENSVEWFSVYIDDWKWIEPITICIVTWNMP